MLILKNAKLLTMAEGPRYTEGDIAVEDGKISAVGKLENGCFLTEAGSMALTGDAAVENFSGCVILPGLFDCHVHYDYDFMGDYFLAGGVTSVRNMSGNKEHARFRDEILAGKRTGPCIYSSGPIVDGEDPTLVNNDHFILRTEEDAEKAIEYTKKYSFIWMKTYPSIEPDIYRYLMKRCREEKLPLCGHMTKKMDYRELAEGGYICCEHTSSLPSDLAVVKELAEAGMWLCPTHVVCETMPDYVWNGKQLSSLERYDDLPGFVQFEWERNNREIIESYHKYNIHPDFDEVTRRGQTFVEYSSPDRIMAGTDCPYPGMIPGCALTDELERLVRVYGLSPYEALCAATVNPARHIGIENLKGSLKAGMDSDMIVVRGDPLACVTDVKNIVKVFLGTRSFTADELQARLDRDKMLTPDKVEMITGADRENRNVGR